MRKIAILFLSFLPVAALAAPATYDLLAPVGTLPATVTLTEYLQGVFKTIVGIVGVLAVIMIVICGIRLMGSGSAGSSTSENSAQFANSFRLHGVSEYACP